MEDNLSHLTQLTDPNFSFKNLDWNTLTGLASTIIENREMHQKVLGRIAAEAGGQYGDNLVEKLATAIYEQTGYKVSPSTLRGYRWVYERVGGLDIPPDLSFSCWKALAGAEDPEEWVTKATENGWSSSETIRNIRISQGKTPVVKLCPHCNKPL